MLQVEPLGLASKWKPGGMSTVTGGATGSAWPRSAAARSSTTDVCIRPPVGMGLWAPCKPESIRDMAPAGLMQIKGG